MANTCNTSLLKEHDMPCTHYTFLVGMGMLLLSQKEFARGTGVENRGDCSSKDKKGKDSW